MLKKFLNVKFLLILIIIVASFLRLYKITVNPPSLFGDELDLGYHAYSVLKTGKDYQGNFMPLHFHSLAEWRTPLYLYSAVPTVAIFGITSLGVRLPAVIFGILGVYAMYLLVNQITKNKSLGLISAFVLAISPWHLQYSRAGFEVTEMLFFLIFGLYLFFKSLDDSRWLWLSVLCLVITPWVYSTAKFFTPVLLVFLFLTYRKEIFALPKSNLIKASLIGLVVGLPLVYSIFFGGGSQRFSYISVFSDPTTEAQIGFEREMNARVRGEMGTGLKPTLVDRVFVNKFTYWGEGIIKNYLTAFSTNFLFIKGDPNPRQSVGIGEFYRFEFIALIVGIAFFIFAKEINNKTKLLVLFWLLFAPIPSALTVDGGNHATRLILLLPPLIFLISYGWWGTYNVIAQKYRFIFVILTAGLYAVSFLFYFRLYHTTYPWTSERWWHAGWGESVKEIKSIDANYDRVIISMKGEPAWIFFAGYYEYDPLLWQKEYPIGHDKEVDGFGMISNTGKYYFGSPKESVQIYGLGKYIDSKTLYLANASEDGENLILHPDKTPSGLKLIKAIPFPSGEPAFYLFSGI